MEVSLGASQGLTAASCYRTSKLAARASAVPRRHCHRPTGRVDQFLHLRRLSELILRTAMIADRFGVTFPDEQRSSQRRTHVALCDLPNLEAVRPNVGSFNHFTNPELDRTTPPDSQIT